MNLLQQAMGIGAASEPSQTNGFIPSKYQASIFEWAQQGTGNALVEAVAGSGKSTTLEQLTKRLNGSILFCAFNKHIAEPMQKKLKNANVSTINSIGHRTVARHLGRVSLDDRKYRTIARELAAPLANDYDERRKLSGALYDLCRFVRITLANPEDQTTLERLIRHYGIEDTTTELLLLVKVAIERGNDLAAEQKIIDFADQLYLPYRWALVPDQYDWVLIDEAQDLNAAQLDLVLKCVNQTGRIVAVGDGRQAIYGFAGADAASFQKIASATNATRLPLSICYRCPSGHLDLAREIVPEIEACDNAPDGIIEHINEQDLHKHLQPNDLVLCRLTAPLIDACLELIARGTPATVRGRDIGKQLTKIVDQATDNGDKSWDRFIWHLDAYRTEQAAKLGDDDEKLQSLEDRVNAVRRCYQEWQSASADAFKVRLEGLFNDKDSIITLSTIHRAKGLEAERVFILRPDKLPLQLRNPQQWQTEQEWNLRYVALTRSKHYLCFAHQETPPEAPQEPEQEQQVSDTTKPDGHTPPCHSGTPQSLYEQVNELDYEYSRIKVDRKLKRRELAQIVIDAGGELEVEGALLRAYAKGDELVLQIRTR
jgi:superfamily I DNA/RNA helicase